MLAQRSELTVLFRFKLLVQISLYGSRLQTTR
jgi:hypothetical protein